jgi:hypothetical protein
MHCCRIALASLFLHSLALAAPTPARSSPEEIPIERCDRLPMVVARVDGMAMRFLLDTAATSMLNLESFARGRSKEIQVSSWTGTAVTSAREVTLSELALGSYRLRNLKLPAINLSPLAKACGGPIDGILGVDLLERMGATIDLKNRVALLGQESPPETERARLEEFRASQRACIEAFNRADADSFENCLDPEVVLFTPWAEVRGRQAMLEHLRERYFALDPPAHIEIRPRDFRLLGDAILFGYEYTLRLSDSVVEARGMAICRKSDGRYRLLNMHNSVVQKETVTHR